MGRYVASQGNLYERLQLARDVDRFGEMLSSRYLEQLGLNPELLGKISLGEFLEASVHLFPSILRNETLNGIPGRERMNEFVVCVRLPVAREDCFFKALQRFLGTGGFSPEQTAEF